ncbi:NAD-dependent epimerase/dehydratase family protein [Streptomyces sp. HNM0663]|uniref:NAD-dependent epimerase/dehydratase family protein n=1 Tax=Streptomyces chengmaiensis TaxID=3040919 RepID=A0ABT6HI46_9ACTN|nr:NAD-dependent epimerase/dehydratase family protein [Streptomyces chengmaiensis]MDH2387918.1 NAD-dependent epimerase/dehydratase family protein [Streptomyces chengmaiensis]
MKALVTGASGFLGGHIVDACVRAGDEVRVLVREQSDLSRLRTVPGVEFAYGDLRDAASLRAAADGVDVVHHSAARVTDRGTRAQFWDENVAGTERLLSAARAGGARRFVFISSPSALMGVRDGDRLGIDESVPYPARHLNLYSSTKAAAERRVLAANGPGLTAVALRPRAVWGPRDHSGFMPRLIAKMLTGSLPDLSGGRPVYASLCYCANAADASVRAARADGVGGRAYFVTDGEPVEVWSMLALLARRFGGTPPTRKVPRGLLRALAFTADTVWKAPPLARRSSPPLSRYSLALLTRSATYDTSAACRDLAPPPVDHDTGMAELQAWIDSIGGVGAYIGKVA